MLNNNIVKFSVFILLITSGCKALMPYVNVVNCDFRMKSVSSVRLGGLDIERISSPSELSFLQIGSLTKAYLSGDLPLSFTLNLEGKNPNASSATLAGFDWILFIDDVQMVSGINETEYQIPANNGLADIPLNISVDLLEVLSGESKDALLNFGFNLADASNKPTRISLKIKPTINVGGVPITYPSYIDLKTEYGD